MTEKKSSSYQTGRPEIEAKIDDLLKAWGVEDQVDYYRDMVVTALKFAKDRPREGDVRQFSRTLKEMRYALGVFAPYRGVRKISIFGSARTPSSRTEFQAARQFAKLMVENGFMVITGGGDGIMGAAQAGAGREKSFALNIELPFEQHANETIAGDRKLINFKYFFTRKLNFVKHSDALAIFPGGFGTMDESFEAITLIQTGKAPIVPIVFVDAPGGNFWKTFVQYIREHLLLDRLISPEDFHLFKVTDSLEEAKKEVLNFYYNFHSYRYVRELCVIRLQREVPPGALQRLRDDFKDILVGSDPLCIDCPLPEEINEPELAHLPRLCLRFNRHGYGRLRQLIDRLNQF